MENNIKSLWNVSTEDVENFRKMFQYMEPIEDMEVLRKCLIIHANVVKPLDLDAWNIMQHCDGDIEAFKYKCDSYYYGGIIKALGVHISNSGMYSIGTISIYESTLLNSILKLTDIQLKSVIQDFMWQAEEMMNDLN